jgi:glycosyltransferase involved in cell wall biosynthesis
MHEILAQNGEVEYSVIFCSRLEPNREWKFKQGQYKHIFLKENNTTMVHNNPIVLKYLKKFNPDVIVSTGFNPTMLYGFAWCMLKGRKFIPYIDGTYKSEQILTSIHRLVRKVIFRFSKAFVGASIGSMELFRSYRVPDHKIFRSCLCIENSLYSKVSLPEKKYDLMFSGQMIDRKMPLFFIEVAKKVKEKLGKLNVLLLGNGVLKDEVLSKLDEYGIEYNYPGFIQPFDIPSYYKQAKIFLFPTKNDPWGIVANEACASGVPVITCDNAGAANDLIFHGKNGYVLTLDVDLWVDHVIELLQNEDLLNTMSDSAYQMVQPFNPQEAASGIMKSIHYSLSN